jgi:hypothetical protein
MTSAAEIRSQAVSAALADIWNPPIFHVYNLIRLLFPEYYNRVKFVLQIKKKQKSDVFKKVKEKLLEVFP